MNRKQRRNIILLITTIFVGVIIFIGFTSYNITKYGSGKYNVNMFSNENDAKNYRLPADVDLESESGEYYLLKVYFPNGGNVNFEDMYGISPMAFNEKVELEDDAGEVWYVELDEKIPSTSWEKIFFSEIVSFLVLIFSLCAFFVVPVMGFFFSMFELDNDEKSKSFIGKFTEEKVLQFQDWLIDLPRIVQTIFFWSSRVIGVVVFIVLLL